MHLAVRQQGNEIKGRPTAESGTAAKEFAVVFIQLDIDQVVLQPNHRVGFSGRKKAVEKFAVLLTFRGLKTGKTGYGFTIYGTKAVVQGGKFGGYEPLIIEIIKFFKTGNVPVPPEETIEIFAFMSAADESKERGGAAVSLKDTIENAQRQNRNRRR